jgi:hypothetical protein
VGLTKSLDIREPSLRVNVIELGSRNQGVDCGGAALRLAAFCLKFPAGCIPRQLVANKPLRSKL